MFELSVESTHRLKRRGVIVTGLVTSGTLRAGGAVHVGGASFTVRQIRTLRRSVESMSESDGVVALLLDESAHGVVTAGMMLTGDGAGPSPAGRTPSHRSVPTVNDLERQIGLGDAQSRRWRRRLKA